MKPCGRTLDLRGVNISPASGPTVLIADDDAAIRRVVVHKFQTSGFTVLEAPDGETALQAARQRTPDLVVTDLQMPFMSGLDLCLALRGDAATAATPAILLTARGHILSDEQMSRTNIRLVLPKPFSARELIEHAKAVLASPGASPARLNAA